MSENMKKLIKDAIYELSQGSSEQLLLALNLDSELYKTKTFMDYLTEETV